MGMQKIIELFKDFGMTESDINKCIELYEEKPMIQSMWLQSAIIQKYTGKQMTKDTSSESMKSALNKYLKKKVSIIIPCYNQAQWLPDAVNSATNQTVSCEIIIVNDGSTDNTDEVAKQFYVDKYIVKENGGLSSARNAGIKEATGEWILTLDADDKISPEFVEKCLKYKDEYDIIGTGQEEFGDSNNKSLFKTNPTLQDFVQNNQINCCSLYRKEIWETIGGYDEEMRLGYEDWDFWLRATQKGYKVITIPEYLFFYRKHGVSMVTKAIENHNQIKQYMLNKLYAIK